MAVFCGVLILLVNFFMNFTLAAPRSYRDLIRLALVSQLVVILTPTLLMAIMLTRKPADTLLLRVPRGASVVLAVLAAMCMAPVANRLSMLVQRLYPASDSVMEFFEQLAGPVPEAWLLVLALAIMPAVCEELAFRGFILSGLRHMGHRWRAIALASFFFGVTHGVVQQSLMAIGIGMLIGFVAVQSGSIVPGMIFHAIHNTLALASTQWTAEVVANTPSLNWLGTPSADGFVYHGLVAVAGALVLAGVVYALYRLPYQRSTEESLVEAIEHEAPAPAA
jgi:sodium transport system permease protein